MSKLDRRNQAKQRRLANNRHHANATCIFSGKDGAPRIVAVVPLCSDNDVAVAISSLIRSVDIPNNDYIHGLIPLCDVERFKQKLQFIHAERDLFAALDACQAADYVLLLLSADREVDEWGDKMLRCIEGQGISNVYTAVQVSWLSRFNPTKSWQTEPFTGRWINRACQEASPSVSLS